MQHVNVRVFPYVLAIGLCSHDWASASRHDEHALVDVQVTVKQVAFVTIEVNSTACDLPDLVYTPSALS